MHLSQAINKAKSVADFNDIFANKVNVQLGWVNDIVTVEGFEGAVNTDLIAQQAFAIHEDPITEDSKRLAAFLAEKVFIPLKKLVEHPANQCSLYQVVALARVGWTPPPAPEFGRTIALKHAMVLGMLDEKYAYW